MSGIGSAGSKTGYSLTAGSYVIHATNNQRGNTTLSGSAITDATISSVTTTRTRCAYLGNDASSTSDQTHAHGRTELLNSTTVRNQRVGTNAAIIVNWEVEETF